MYRNGQLAEATRFYQTEQATLFSETRMKSGIFGEKKVGMSLIQNERIFVMAVFKQIGTGLSKTYPHLLNQNGKISCKTVKVYSI